MLMHLFWKPLENVARILAHLIFTENSYYKTKMCFRLAFKKKTREGQMSRIIQLCQIFHCIWLVGTFGSELISQTERKCGHDTFFDIQFQIKSRQEQTDEIRRKGGQTDFPQTIHVIKRNRTPQNFKGLLGYNALVLGDRKVVSVVLESMKHQQFFSLFIESSF